MQETGRNFLPSGVQVLTAARTLQRLKFRPKMHATQKVKSSLAPFLLRPQLRVASLYCSMGTLSVLHKSASVSCCHASLLLSSSSSSSEPALELAAQE